jgi:simple sugar transport system substrate-binding protein
MSFMLNRRQMLTGLAAGAALPLVGKTAFAEEPLKIGMVYLGPPGDFGWTYAHDQGRKLIEKVFGDKIKVSTVENVAEGPDAERVIRQLADGGNRLIFTTSFGYMNPTVKVAKQYKKVMFEHCSGYQRLPNLSTYNARFYEGRAVCGVIAAGMSKTGIAGYLASFPIPEVVLGINAFTLAARKVNPNFKTKVLWASTWYDPAKEADAAKALLDQGADVIAQHTDSPAALQACEQRGLFAFGQAADMASFAPKAHLTAIINNWGPYYERRVKAMFDGTWASTNTWGGFGEDMIEMAPYNPAIPQAVVKQAEDLRQALAAGKTHAFAGPITDNKGASRVKEGDTIADPDLAKMDWYVEGVQS